MIGLIPNILEKLVIGAAGENALRAIKDRAGIPVDRKYDLNKVYSDDEWQRLYDATRAVLGVTPEQAEELYADVFCRDVLERFPMWFKMSRNSREFLLRQPAIHNAFSTGLRNPAERAAVLDKFRVVEADDSLTTYYCSPNRLCGLYVALVRWMLQHYGDVATINELECMKRGAAECQIQVQWTSLRPA